MTHNHIRTWLSSVLLLFGSSFTVMGQWQVGATPSPTNQRICSSQINNNPCPAGSTCSSWQPDNPIVFCAYSDPYLNRTITPAATLTLVDNTRFVGIGTALPVTKLHVVDTKTSLLKLTNSAGSTSAAIDFATFNDANNNTNARIAAIDGSGFNASLAFYTDGDGVQNSNLLERMRIDKGGNVGIGTTNPSQMLDVIGTVVSNGYSLSRDNTNRGSIWFASTLDNNHRLYNNASNVDGEGAFDGVKWNVNAGINIRVSTASPTVKQSALYIDGTGKVGLNITAPTEQLHVMGNIKVVGLVKAADICLTPGASCDYVFDTDYRLRTLPELKSFIQKNKHLPYIPSEKEVVEKGTTFNNMVFAQLRTIEELVLYTIKQDEKIEQMEKKIELLQKKENNKK